VHHVGILYDHILLCHTTGWPTLRMVARYTRILYLEVFSKICRHILILVEIEPK